jgi:hypothetical protein
MQQSLVAANVPSQFRILEVYYRTYNSHKLIPNLRQMNLIHIIKSYLLIVSLILFLHFTHLQLIGLKSSLHFLQLQRALNSPSVSQLDHFHDTKL